MLRWLTTGSELAFGTGQVLGTSAGASTQMKTGLVRGQHCWQPAPKLKRCPVLGQVLGTSAGASTQMKTGLVRGQYWQPAPKHPTYTRTNYINYINYANLTYLDLLVPKRRPTQNYEVQLNSSQSYIHQGLKLLC